MLMRPSRMHLDPNAIKMAAQVRVRGICIKTKLRKSQGCFNLICLKEKLVGNRIKVIIIEVWVC